MMEAARVPLAVFVRAPVPGETKTRLAPVLGDEGSAALYRAFVWDVLEHVPAGLEAELWCAGELDHPELVALAERHHIRRVAQPEVGLGARMATALAAAIARSGRGLVIGSDSPTLGPELLSLAAAALDEADVVLGPSADGGYYLVGMRGAVAPIFEGVRWSTHHVLEDTLALAGEAGLQPRLLAPWYDVDTPDDLRLLRAHLALAPEAAPHTAAQLGLARDSGAKSV